MDKIDKASETDFTELLALARSLDRKQKTLFISASRGLITGIQAVG